MGNELHGDTLHFELHGTSPNNNERITGKINLKIQSAYFGYYSINALVTNDSFKMVIGDLPFSSSKNTNPAVSDTQYDGEKESKNSAYPWIENIRKKAGLSDYVLFNKTNTRFPEMPRYESSAGSYKGSGDYKKNYDFAKKVTLNHNEDTGGNVTVFYGTNRNKTGDKPNSYYGNELGDFEQGLCVISIPPGHKQGVMERPGKVLWLFPRKQNPEKHIVLQSINVLEENDFYNYLREGLNQTDNKAALIFVHGFNTSFDEAARRCGQICYDVPFSGITGFFGWPSAGNNVFNYVRDVERADASVSSLTAFIENIVDNTGVKKLHFIAHSMGNRILTRSLNQLIQKETFKNKINTIAQIILAAPDIDTDVFNNEIYPSFRKIGKRRTIYASDEDMALFFSEKIRRGLKRLGEGGDNIYVVNGIDTIDASNVMSKGMLRHSYVFETKDLLYDLNTLFTEGAAPEKRRLRKKLKK